MDAVTRTPVQLRGRRARAERTLNERPNDPAALAARDDARRDLAAANIAAAIDRALASAPDLTDDQAEALAARLRGGGS